MFSSFLSFAASLIGGLVIICWPSLFLVVLLRRWESYFFVQIYCIFVS